MLAEHYKLFQDDTKSNSNNNNNNSNNNLSSSNESTTATSGGEKKVFRRIFCEVQGVCVSLDSPIFQLWTIFSHADLFLYIVITTCDEE